jgi:hypothetical protein
LLVILCAGKGIKGGQSTEAVVRDIDKSGHARS